MIEVIIKNYLDSHLDVPSFLERPENPPKQYVLIEKTGSSKNDYINSATLAFQSYAESLFEAATLNEKLKNVLEELIYEANVSKAKLNTDYNFTDPETKEYRYQAVYDFTF